MVSSSGRTRLIRILANSPVYAVGLADHGLSYRDIEMYEFVWMAKSAMSLLFWWMAT